MTDYLCDTNVWLAIAVAPHTHHAVARAWFDEVPTSASIHFCRSTQQSFLRLVTSGWLRATYGLSPLTNARTNHGQLS